MDQGDQVSEGQVLAKISDAAYQGQLRSLESNLELATETFLKQEALWKQQIGSEIQYIQAKTTKESLDAQITGLKKQIDMTQIKSPISGTVEESMIRVGQSVSASLPAFRVVSFNNLKVIAEVAEAYTSKVSQGDKVVIYLPDIDEEIAARVSFCSRYINPNNRTFTVEAQLSTNNNQIKANMVAIMKINDYQSPESFALPINMIQSDNKGDFVLLANKENDQYVARKRIVRIGQVYNGLAEVVDGLDLESKIITSGYLNINEGEIIRF